ncbi:hypothetical protein CR513_17708, partial [Mucuna pruriens]
MPSCKNDANRDTTSGTYHLEKQILGDVQDIRTRSTFKNQAQVALLFELEPKSIDDAFLDEGLIHIKQVDDGIYIHQTNINEQLAGIFTKPLPKDKLIHIQELLELLLKPHPTFTMAQNLDLLKTSIEYKIENLEDLVVYSKYFFDILALVKIGLDLTIDLNTCGILPFFNHEQKPESLDASGFLVLWITLGSFGRHPSLDALQINMHIVSLGSAYGDRHRFVHYHTEKLRNRYLIMVRIQMDPSSTTITMVDGGGSPPVA